MYTSPSLVRLPVSSDRASCAAEESCLAVRQLNLKNDVHILCYRMNKVLHGWWNFLEFRYDVTERRYQFHKFVVLPDILLMTIQKNIRALSRSGCCRLTCLHLLQIDLACDSPAVQQIQLPYPHIRHPPAQRMRQLQEGTIEPLASMVQLDHCCHSGMTHSKSHIAIKSKMMPYTIFLLQPALMSEVKSSSNSRKWLDVSDMLDGSSDIVDWMCGWRSWERGSHWDTRWSGSIP